MLFPAHGAPDPEGGIAHRHILDGEGIHLQRDLDIGHPADQDAIHSHLSAGSTTRKLPVPEMIDIYDANLRPLGQMEEGLGLQTPPCGDIEVPLHPGQMPGSAEPRRSHGCWDIRIGRQGLLQPAPSLGQMTSDEPEPPQGCNETQAGPRSLRLRLLRGSTPAPPAGCRAPSPGRPPRPAALALAALGRLVLPGGGSSSRRPAGCSPPPRWPSGAPRRTPAPPPAGRSAPPAGSRLR